MFEMKANTTWQIGKCIKVFLTLKILSVFCQEDTLSSYFRPSKDQPDLGQSACTLKSVLTETREWRSIHTWQNLLSLLLSILP